LENIVIISGKVDYTITLDPGVWLFDDRKINLATYFDSSIESKIESNYAETAGSQWDKALKEGSTLPSKNSNKISKQEIQPDADYGIGLGPFLKNASPNIHATKVILYSDKDEQYQISLDEAFEGILAFSSNGRPVKDGPIHFYYKDGRNKNTPYTNINKIVVD
jgi:hypothetical protein